MPTGRVPRVQLIAERAVPDCLRDLAEQIRDIGVCPLCERLDNLRATVDGSSACTILHRLYVHKMFSFGL